MNPNASAAKRIVVRYPNRRSVLSRARGEGDVLALFVPTSEPVESGQIVGLDISFGDCDAKYSLVGRVTYRRTSDRGLGFESGLGVAFDGEDKKIAAQMIAQCAGRAVDVGTANSARQAVHVRCLVRVSGRTVSAEVRDLSSSGAFVVTRAKVRLRRGDELVLQLDPLFASFGGRRLTAKVVWVGQKSGTAGFGACFVGESTTIRPLVRKFLNQS